MQDEVVKSKKEKDSNIFSYGCGKLSKVVGFLSVYDLRNYEEERRRFYIYICMHATSCIWVL